MYSAVNDQKYMQPTFFFGLKINVDTSIYKRVNCILWTLYEDMPCVHTQVNCAVSMEACACSKHH